MIQGQRNDRDKSATENRTHPSNYFVREDGKHPSHRCANAAQTETPRSIAGIPRSRHYSRRTEQTYCQWVKRFIFFHHVRHPVEMAEPEMNHIYDRNSAFSVGVLYGKYCGVWGFIPIHINIDGSDASRRAIGAADCHPLLSWRFAPVHQAAAAGSRSREQARVYASR